MKLFGAFRNYLEYVQSERKRNRADITMHRYSQSSRAEQKGGSMRYRIEQITEGEEEVIVHYRTLTPEVRQILDFLGQGQTRLMGWKDETKVIVKPEQILYVESVDGKTFAYTKGAVVRLEYQLSQLEQLLWERHFFLFSKSMIVNIDKVESLKSLPSNRIDAVMCNGEHIIISRTYASEFRKRLKGGRDNGET